MNDIWVESFNDFICLAFKVCLSELGLSHLLTIPVHKPLGICDEGITQAGSGVAGLLSSGIGFNHSSLFLIFGRWTESVSFKSDILAVSSIEEEDGLYHHVVSCETCLFQQETRPSMPVLWTPQEHRGVLHVLGVIYKRHFRTCAGEGFLSFVLYGCGGGGRVVVIGVVVAVKIGAFVEDDGLGEERSMIGMDNGGIKEEA
nr:hypothetical protein [Tanacetum cinerariifolium]